MQSVNSGYIRKQYRRYLDGSSDALHCIATHADLLELDDPAYASGVLTLSQQYAVIAWTQKHLSI